MSYYRIRNNTNTLGKRHPRFNTPQIIEFKDLLENNEVSVAPSTEIIVETAYLPVSAQKLRAEGLITIVEIDKQTYHKLRKNKETQLAEEAKNAAIVEQEIAKVAKSEERSKKYATKLK